jgi:hypothetical protein
MSIIHSLDEYKRALEVVRDFPEILEIIDQTLYELEPYKHYTYALELYTNLIETAMWLELELQHYEEVVSKKGMES